MNTQHKQDDPNCPFCGVVSTPHVRQREIKGRTVSGLEHYECGECGAVFLTAGQSTRNKQRVIAVAGAKEDERVGE